jgi:hypothetical protein
MCRHEFLPSLLRNYNQPDRNLKQCATGGICDMERSNRLNDKGVLARMSARGSIGKPLEDLRTYILDERLEPVPIGVRGELYVSGAGLTRGYLHRGGLTAWRFIANPFESSQRMYRTGDMGRWRSDGTIEYLQRNDEQVKIRGYRIELGEIESQLQAHSGVRQAVVLAREDVPGEKRLVAYVVHEAPGEQKPRSEEPPEPPQLREYLKSVLPDYMIPAAFVMLEELPLTGNGKLDRSALPAPAPAPRHVDYAEAASPKEKILQEIWKQALHLEQFGVRDNPFDAGADSLLLMRVIARANAALETSLTPMDLFRHPTISELTAYLERGVATRVDLSAIEDQARRRKRRPRGVAL